MGKLLFIKVANQQEEKKIQFLRKNQIILISYKRLEMSHFFDN